MNAVNWFTRLCALFAVAAVGCSAALLVTLANSPAGQSCQAVAKVSNSLGSPAIPGECWTSQRPWALGAAAAISAAAAAVAWLARRHAA